MIHALPSLLRTRDFASGSEHRVVLFTTVCPNSVISPWLTYKGTCLSIQHMDQSKFLITALNLSVLGFFIFPFVDINCKSFPLYVQWLFKSVHIQNWKHAFQTSSRLSIWQQLKWGSKPALNSLWSTMNKGFKSCHFHFVVWCISWNRHQRNTTSGSDVCNVVLLCQLLIVL